MKRIAVLCIVPVVLVSTRAAAAPWRADWIIDPRFRDARPIDRLHREKEKPSLPPHDPDLRNVHSTFRREFDLASGARAARIRITADDYYFLYVNGRFVGQGPAPGYVFAYPYLTHDLTRFLRAGRNAVAVHVYYQGLVNRVWGSGDHRQGLIAEIDATLEDGSRVAVETDASWRVHEERAYTGRRTTGYETQFLEDVDGRLLPIGWQEVGFDDSGWSRPIARPLGETGYALVEQQTPPLEVDEVHPVEVRRIGEGLYAIDFGTEVTGTLGLRVTGPAGHRIEIRHGEERGADGRVRYKMRANCEYRDTWILRGVPDERIQLFDYKGFRYAEILDAPSPLDRDAVWVRRRHYPFDPARSGFRSSVPLLDRIWTLCINGVRYGSQEVFVDCPTREKGQYLGDAYVTGITHIYAQGDPRLTRRALSQFALSSRICPGLMAVAPGSFMQEIADYSLQWPLFLEDYYRLTGDQALVRDMTATLRGLLGYFQRYENADGLLEKVDRKWNLVDWPQNLRDGFDYDRAAAGVNGVLNAFYQGTLASSARLLDIAGDSDAARALRARAARHADAFRRRLIDPRTNLALDAVGSTHSALHPNALALLFGLIPEDGRSSVLAHLREKRLSCGVYISFFVLRALTDAGEADLAFDLITSKDERSWHTMLAAGATTCMEAWGPEQKWNTSWCHPWSSAPVSIVAERFMGLRPGAPGWAFLDFAPQTPRALESAAIHVTTPRGRCSASHRRIDDRTIEYAVETPPDVPVRPRLPVPRDASLTVTADGSACSGRIGAGWWRADAPLSGGEHAIRVRRD
ncbi:MAG: family 78 glycoside hydrolase catalytic domain [Planctomycetes bacterium]|nr:family 78 glycoside hydrolase catalytic domain [Planctomycetota bacterium]